jgi:phosphoglycolate phosphatase-like HAD superfamily hydrolase
MEKSRLLLWDIDGTLILGGNVGSKALKNYFNKRYGWSDLGSAMVVHGMTDPGIVQGIFDHFGHKAQPGEIDEVLRDYVEIMRANMEGFESSRLLPGVPEILTVPTGQGMCLQGLLTGNVEAAAELKLAHHNLWDDFEFGAYGSDAIKREDLVPVAWERAKQLSGREFRPEETWIIGDTIRDYRAAKHHGAKVVLVRTNSAKGSTELDESGAELVLDDLRSYDRFWSTIWE